MGWGCTDTHYVSWVGLHRHTMLVGDGVTQTHIMLVGVGLHRHTLCYGVGLVEERKGEKPESLKEKP